MKKIIPNLFTLLNLFCGCTAISLITPNNLNLNYVLFLVILGIFFDLLDGFFARKFKVQSELGLQLDSLADLVTSGVVPALLIYNLLLEINFNFPETAFAITLASAYRLAKFNISPQTDYFIGLPTPANTIFIISIPLILKSEYHSYFKYIILNQWTLIGIIIISCFLLNSKLKLISLKFKNLAFDKYNLPKYILVFSSIILLIFFKFLAIPFILFIYIFISLLFKYLK